MLPHHNHLIENFTLPPELVNLESSPAGLARLVGRQCVINHVRNQHQRFMIASIKCIGLEHNTVRKTNIFTLGIDLVTFMERDVKDLSWTSEHGWRMRFYTEQEVSRPEEECTTINITLTLL